MPNVSEIEGQDKEVRPEWPSPTEEQINSPQFNAIWNVIKSWDVNIPDQYFGYCGANGNHVVAILNALRDYFELAQAVKEMLIGVERWANDEDGIPEELAPAYLAVKDLLRRLGG